MENARGLVFPFFSQRPSSEPKDAADPQASRETEGQEKRVVQADCETAVAPSQMIPECAKNAIHSVSLQVPGQEVAGGT